MRFNVSKDSDFSTECMIASSGTTCGGYALLCKVLVYGHLLGFWIPRFQQRDHSETHIVYVAVVSIW